MDKIKIESFGRRIVLNIQITCDADGDAHSVPAIREALHSLDLLSHINPTCFEGASYRPDGNVKVVGEAKWYSIQMINGDPVSIRGLCDDSIKLSPNADALLFAFEHADDDKVIVSYRDEKGNVQFAYKDIQKGAVLE